MPAAPVAPGNAPDRDTASDAGDWLSLSLASGETAESGVLTPLHPAVPFGGGAALPPRGGSGGLSNTPTSRPASNRSGLASATPSSSGARPSASAGSSAALLAGAAGAAGGSQGPTPVSAARGGPPAGPPTSSQPPANAGHGPSITPNDGPGGAPTSGGATAPGSTPDPVAGNASGPSEESFPYFPVYVLDVNDGVVVFPGVDQLATLHGSVILQAQVSDATVSSYDWDTSGISSDASSISGGSTYQLSFQWTNDVVTAHVDPITLSVTDSDSHTETYTYSSFAATKLFFGRELRLAA
jgi:hypothetical protein